MVISDNFNSDEGSAQIKLILLNLLSLFCAFPESIYIGDSGSFKKLWNYFLGLYTIRNIHNGLIRI